MYYGPVNSSGERLLPENLLPDSEFSKPDSYIATMPGVVAGFTSFASKYASDYASWPSLANTIEPMNISNHQGTLRDSRSALMENLHHGGSADLYVFESLGLKLLISKSK